MKIKSNLVCLMYLNLMKFLSHQVNHIWGRKSSASYIVQ